MNAFNKFLVAVLLLVALLVQEHFLLKKPILRRRCGGVVVSPYLMLLSGVFTTMLRYAIEKMQADLFDSHQNMNCTFGQLQNSNEVEVMNRATQKCTVKSSPHTSKGSLEKVIKNNESKQLKEKVMNENEGEETNVAFVYSPHQVDTSNCKGHKEATYSPVTKRMMTQKSFFPSDSVNDRELSLKAVTNNSDVHQKNYLKCRRNPYQEEKNDTSVPDMFKNVNVPLRSHHPERYLHRPKEEPYRRINEPMNERQHFSTKEGICDTENSTKHTELYLRGKIKSFHKTPYERPRRAAEYVATSKQSYHDRSRPSDTSYYEPMDENKHLCNEEAICVSQNSTKSMEQPASGKIKSFEESRYEGWSRKAEYNDSMIWTHTPYIIPVYEKEHCSNKEGICVTVDPTKGVKQLSSDIINAFVQCPKEGCNCRAEYGATSTQSYHNVSEPTNGQPIQSHIPYIEPMNEMRHFSNEEGICASQNPTKSAELPAWGKIKSFDKSPFEASRHPAEYVAKCEQSHRDVSNGRDARCMPSHTSYNDPMEEKKNFSNEEEIYASQNSTNSAELPAWGEMKSFEKTLYEEWNREAEYVMAKKTNDSMIWTDTPYNVPVYEKEHCSNKEGICVTVDPTKGVKQLSSGIINAFDQCPNEGCQCRAEYGATSTQSYHNVSEPTNGQPIKSHIPYIEPMDEMKHFSYEERICASQNSTKSAELPAWDRTKSFDKSPFEAWRHPAQYVATCQQRYRDVSNGRDVRSIPSPTSYNDPMEEKKNFSHEEGIYTSQNSTKSVEQPAWGKMKSFEKSPNEGWNCKAASIQNHYEVSTKFNSPVIKTDTPDDAPIYEKEHLSNKEDMCESVNATKGVKQPSSEIINAFQTCYNEVSKRPAEYCPTSLQSHPEVTKTDGQMAKTQSAQVDPLNEDIYSNRSREDDYEPTSWKYCAFGNYGVWTPMVEYNAMKQKPIKQYDRDNQSTTSTPKIFYFH